MKLANGSVLVTTNRDAAVFVDTAVTPTGPMQHLRFEHALVALPDGGALAIGGSEDFKKPPLKSCERFDPATATWRPAPPLLEARQGHAGLLVGDRILVIGGAGVAGEPLASVEAWRPGELAWTALPALWTAREAPRAVVLKDGRVLVANGGVEMWNPTRGSWAPSCRGPRRTSVALAALRSGGAMIIGGIRKGRDVATVDVLGKDGKWRRGKPLPETRSDCAALQLPNGEIGIVGGEGTRSMTEDSGTGGELDYEYRSFPPVTWVDKVKKLSDALVSTPEGEWAYRSGREILWPQLTHFDDRRVLISGDECWLSAL